MDDDLLRTIIVLEKQLQAQLAEEQNRAEAWAEREVGLLDQDLADYRQRLNTREANWLEAAERRLRLRWQQWEAGEKARQQAFLQYAGERLRSRLEANLGRILPDGDDDHQDVES